jgi:hypothetical protein
MRWLLPPIFLKNPAAGAAKKAQTTSDSVLSIVQVS